MKRRELEAAKDRLADERWESRYGEQEDDKERRQREYLDWYLGKK